MNGLLQFLPHARILLSHAAGHTQLHETEVFWHVANIGITLTSYESKSQKSVAILSGLCLEIQVSREDNPKHKPNSVLL